MLKQLINDKRPDLNTYTANNNVYVFKQGQQITFKAVPIEESNGTKWYCNTQDRNAEPIKFFWGLTAEKILNELNQLFPKQ